MPERQLLRCANVLGVGVSAVNMELALATVATSISQRCRGYVCVSGVHGVMEAQKSAAFRKILNQSLINLPDGMPTVWAGRVQGHSTMRRVFGPDFMLALCGASVDQGWSHFFYGGAAGVASDLATSLLKKFPGLKVAGSFTPPFRPLNPQEETDLLDRVSQLKPDIFWVGLSTPKQENFMAQFVGRLEATLLIGVGAAFDYHTGRLRDAPSWMKNSGLQWVHRLYQEPRRLWRRYLVNNPKFLYRIVPQLLGITDYSL